MHSTPHSFHIPVMGTGFTIDTPLKVARYGITSVISLVDDSLMEQMRRYHSQKLGEPYEEIKKQDHDSRARRITAYLNFLDHTVQKQFAALRNAAFEKGSEIYKYFEMLPKSELKTAFEDMLHTKDRQAKEDKQEMLRRMMQPGDIEVNIMTKLDRDSYRDGVTQPAKFSDALAALRGFANSTLRSAVVLSAGINRRLYRYMAEFSDFFPDQNGGLKKQITLKVNDYRSALVQGKFLAKLGLWVSEYRIESGINCGGHAFVTTGKLLGPALDEFNRQREELSRTLLDIYAKALHKLGMSAPLNSMQARLTVQGGIGTAAEDGLLLKYYRVDGTGWGTPFLMVPNAVNLDQAHREKLKLAREADIELGNGSPLGVPFWNLRTSASEEARRDRISQGEPGSPCNKTFAALNTEFTRIPICPSSRSYLTRKLKSLGESTLPAEQLLLARKEALQKTCLCQDLAGSATVENEIDPETATAVCCGPNIINFKKTASLREMVGHIYGELSLLTDRDRPHMFISEIRLYLQKLIEDLNKPLFSQSKPPQKYLDTISDNLLQGIQYYRGIANQIIGENKERFLKELMELKAEIEDSVIKRREMAACATG